MSALTQKTLSLIEKRQVRPLPAWRARVKNIAYWCGTGGLLALAALAMTVSFHALFEIDWDAYAKAHFSWYQTLLSGVPLFSLLLLALFIWTSVLLLHQTRRGYRYSLLALTGLFLSTSMVFGYFLEESPLDESAEKVLLYALPHHEKIRATLLPSAERQWSQPERGLLGGAVQSSNATSMMLRDGQEKLWTVDYTDATVGSDVRLEPEREVKVIGSQDGEHTFRATEVRSWERKSKKQQSGMAAPVPEKEAEVKPKESESTQTKEQDEIEEETKEQDEERDIQEDDGEDEPSDSENDEHPE